MSKENDRKEISANTALFLKNGGQITKCRPGPMPKWAANTRHIVGIKYSVFQRGRLRVNLNMDNRN